jgi:uncharacterized protein YecT (DUF1311 family)
MLRLLNLETAAMTRTTFATFAIIAGCIVSVQAQEKLSDAYASCMEKASGATPAMQDCIAGELARQDKRLNESYKELMASLEGKRKSQLREVQRKWLAFRDANCAFYDKPDGGQADRLAANECVVQFTAQRATELEGLKGQ